MRVQKEVMRVWAFVFVSMLYCLGRRQSHKTELQGTGFFFVCLLKFGWEERVPFCKLAHRFFFLDFIVGFQALSFVL